MLKEAASKPELKRSIEWTASIGILLGVGLRLAQLWGDQRLWLDELFSVAVAESPLRDVVLATLRYDTHPPLYYIQLHFWSLFGQSDTWFLLNSLTLSLISLPIMWLSVRRHYGTRAAYWATAVLAVLPLGIFFSENVRMYAWLTILMTLFWSVIEDGRRHGFSGPAALTRLGVLAIMITLSHGLGFFIVFFCMLYAALPCLTAAERRKELRGLSIAYVPAALLSGWSLVISSFRKTEGVQSFSFVDVSEALGLTLLGLEVPAPVVTGILALAAICLLALYHPKPRGLLFWLVLLPWIVLLILSLAIKPVLIYRTMGLFLPFLAIALGLSVASLSKPVLRNALGSALVLICVASGVNYTLTFEKDGYRKIIEELDATAASDALIVAPVKTDAWAVARYLPPTLEERSALDLQPPVRGGMANVADRLKGTLLDRWGFFGRVDQQQFGARTLVTQLSANMVTGSREIWAFNGTAGCKMIGGDTEFTARDQIEHQGAIVTRCLPNLSD